MRSEGDERFGRSEVSSWRRNQVFLGSTETCFTVGMEVVSLFAASCLFGFCFSSDVDTDTDAQTHWSIGKGQH